MLYYQPTYRDAKFILATTAEPRAIWMVGDKPPPVKPTAMLGSIEWTYALLDVCGIARPRVISYQTFPAMLRHFHRQVYQLQDPASAEGDIIQWPAFIKPAKALKTWTGRVFEHAADFRHIISAQPQPCSVDVSAPVGFHDELRTFWYRDASTAWVLAAAVAYPQIDETPDLRDEQALGSIRPDPALPCTTLVIDIGTLNGQPAIVEIGDMFAMGTYGADAAYLHCHKMWCQAVMTGA